MIYCITQKGETTHTFDYLEFTPTALRDFNTLLYGRKKDKQLKMHKMENNNNREYDREGGNPQDQRQNYSSSSDSGNNYNQQKESTKSENPSTSDKTMGLVNENNTPGFASGTNPDRYNSVSDGLAEDSSSVSYTETERYSALNSDFEERKDTEEEIPDSEGFENDYKDDDFKNNDSQQSRP